MGIEGNSKNAAYNITDDPLPTRRNTSVISIDSSIDSDCHCDCGIDEKPSEGSEWSRDMIEDGDTEISWKFIFYEGCIGIGE